MPATLFISRTRACLVGCFVALGVGAGCKNGAEDKGASGSKGGAGATATGGSAGTQAAAGGTGPVGGTSGSASGGTATGGSGAGGEATGATGGSPSGGSAGSTAGGGATGGSGAAGGGGGGDSCTGATFCDDFEDATNAGPPASPWTVQRGGSATAVVDQTHRMSGTQSVKLDVPSGPGRAYIVLANAPVFPISGNAFYGRVMVWLQTAPTTAVHWTLVEAGGLVPMQTYHALYRLGGQHPIMNMSMFVGSQLMANYETPDGYSNNGPRSDCWHHANRVVLPTARWSCFEWWYDGPNNAITLWVDGTEVLGVRGMGSSANGDGCVTQSATYPWTAPTFDTVRLGWESYQTDTARTLWLDDVALAATRVGCPSGMGQ